MDWTEAEIMEKMSVFQLFPHQQSALETGIRLDQFSLDKSTLQFQVFSDWKKRLVNSITASHQSSTLLLDTMD